MRLSDSSSPPRNDFEKFDPEVARLEYEKKKLREFLKFRDSRTGKALVADIKSWHAEAKANRTPEERQWGLNLAAYRGRNDLGLIPALPGIPQHLHGRIGRLPKSQQPKTRINRVRPVIRTEMARLISQKPSASVSPASADEEDLFAAQAGEQAWQSIQERGKLQDHFASAAFWTTIAGTGFMKVWWDAGKFDHHSHITGDICFDASSPFHIFIPDKLEKDIEGQPWVIHAFAKPIGWAERQFSKQLNGIKLQATTARSSDIVDDVTLGVTDTGMSEKNSVLIYEAWLKPGAHPALPEGGVVTIVNDILVGYTETYPYHHGEFPFAKYESMPTETFYSDSVIVDIAQLNHEYNINRDRIQQSIEKMSSLQLMAPQGSIVPQKMTNEIGQVILYRPGLGRPEPFPVQSIPGYIPQALDRTLLDIEDISGQHQVSKGNVPPGVTAATALSFLQERDETYFVHTVRSVERGMEKIGRQALNLAVQYWDDARIVKSVGDDAVFDIQVLRGVDLSSGTDLKIEAGSALPESKAARQALLMDLMAQGFIPPEEGLKLLEIGGSRKIMDQMRIDERQAQRENHKLRQLTPEDIQAFESQWMLMMQQEQMSGGVISGDALPTGEAAYEPPSQLEPPAIIPVNTWDNHEVHIEIHNRFRKSQVFEMLPTEVKAQFERHVKDHESAMIQKSMNDFMAMIPSDGTIEGEPGQEGADMMGAPTGMPDDGTPGPLGDTPVDPAAGASMQGVEGGM